MASYARATMPTSFKARRVGNTPRARRAARGNGGGVISFIRGVRPPRGGIMRRGSPFHSRTSAACESWEWRGWSGYLAASSYSLVPEMEYYAIRHSAGLLDVSPLYKYRIRGKDAVALVNKVVTRNAKELRKEQIYYTPWCEERVKTVGDGTRWRLEGRPSRHHSRGHARPGRGADRGGPDLGGGRLHTRPEGGHRRAAVFAVRTEPRLDRRPGEGPFHRTQGSPRGEAPRSRPPHDGPRDRLGRGGEILSGHGPPSTPSVRAVAAEGPPLCGLSPDRLGHERLLVPAPEEIHRDRDRRISVLETRHARPNRGRGRMGTASGPGDRRGAPVLRAGPQKVVSGTEAL